MKWQYIVAIILFAVGIVIMPIGAKASGGCQYFGDNPQYPVLYNSHGNALPECMTPDGWPSGDSAATFGMPKHINCAKPPKHPYKATCGEPGAKPVKKHKHHHHTTKYAVPNTGV
jgi:hypothetical protein